MSLSITSIEDITKELESQLNKLNTIQDEIGYSAERKEEDRVRLFQSVVERIDSHLREANKNKEDIEQSVNRIYESILSYKTLLGEFASDRPILDPTQSLLSSLAELEAEEERVKERYDTRLVRVKELYAILSTYADIMTIHMPIITTTEIDVSTPTIHCLEEEVERCNREYKELSEQTETKIRTLYGLFVLLGIDMSHDQDRLVNRYYCESDENKKTELLHLLMTKDSMEYIENRSKELEDIKTQVISHKESIILHLKHLWERLDIDMQHRETFMMSNRGYTQKELKNYEDEFNRLLVMKQERIGDFVMSTRKEIESLWERLYYSDEQRNAFQEIYTDEFSEEVLEAHENELSRLLLEYEDSKYILEVIEKHMKLKKEIDEFEAKAKDPDRLLGKGQRDPGRLLREEKFRKRVSRELPKITKELEGSLLEFEAMKGHPFLVYGQPYFNVIYNESTPSDDKKHTLPPRTPKRGVEVRQPLTSPRRKASSRHLFHTPQSNRTRPVQYDKQDMNDSDSILHRVREKNIQKRLKRGASFTEITNENIKPSDTNYNEQKKYRHNQSSRYGNIGFDMGLFDDGPELSDMSDME